MRERTNEEWVNELGAIGQVKETAVADLHTTILSGLPYALSNWLSPSNPQIRAITEEIAQVSVLRVLDKLDTFERRSTFTTWVHKITTRIALTELRMQRWKDFSLDEILDAEDHPAPIWLLGEMTQKPDISVEQADSLKKVQQIVMEELTEKQRKAMVATSIQGIPMDVVARKMNMKRNALYRLMHDARLRLKNRLAFEGLRLEDILSTFKGG